MWEKIKTWNGYKIRKQHGKVTYVYVKSCRNGNYTYSLDYLYGKAFSEKTADKHLKELNQKGR